MEKSSTLPQAEAELCSPERASEIVKLIIGSYPNRGTTDIGIYARQMVAMLSRYPLSVTEKLAHPVHGVVTRYSFLPSLSEVKTFADGLTPKGRYSSMGAAPEVRRELPKPSEQRPTMAELKAQYGENWGIGETEERRDPMEDFTALCAKHGVDPDSIPDAPSTWRKA